MRLESCGKAPVICLAVIGVFATGWLGGVDEYVADKIALYGLYRFIETEPPTDVPLYIELAALTDGVRDRGLVDDALPVVSLLKSRKGYVRVNAILVLDRIGADALPAINELQEVSHDESSHRGTRNDVRRLITKLEAAQKGD